MLLFLIDIYIFGFDIAPDFVGWMSMLGAVAMLTGKVKGIERIRTFGQIMLGYEGATVYKGNIIKNLIMDCQSYTKYRPNETTGGIFVSWRRKEELPTGA